MTANSLDFTPGASSADLRFEVLNSFDSPPIDRDAWDRLAVEVDGGIHRSYDWCRIWWKHYGRGRDLRLILIRKGDLWVGLHPCFIDRIGWGPFRVRGAKEVGSEFTPGILPPLIREEYVDYAVPRIVEILIREEGCDYVGFGPILGEHPLPSTLDSLKTNGLEVFPTPKGTEAVLHLAGEFSEYLAGLSRNHRTNYKRSLNRLKREVGFVARSPDDPEKCAALFEEFVALHTDQWLATGESGHFGDWPGALEFHREMVKVQAELGRLLIVTGMSNEGIVSMQYCYGLGGLFSWLLPARKVDSTWDRYGLGRVGFVGMVEKATEKGFRTMHLGGAYWRYKTDLGAVEEEVWTVAAAPEGKSALRVRRLLKAFRLIDLVYYKIWFKRIAPRLPFQRGPLWNLWIRWKL